MKIYLLLFFLMSPLMAETWLSAGLGVYFPLKHDHYSYDIGPGWSVSIEHELYQKHGNAMGFLMGVSNYNNHINDYFYHLSTTKLMQNEIQLGLFYRLPINQYHNLELSSGYISKGIEGSSKYQGISLSESGFFCQIGDHYTLSDNIALQGKIYWSFVNTETNWGGLQISGPGIELHLKLRILSSEN